MASTLGPQDPPGIYTDTIFGTAPIPQTIPSRIPLFIGTGRELLSRSGLTVVRGSSSVVDTPVAAEDVAGRAVAQMNPDGSVTLGDFDGTRPSFQVRNFPLVTGDGTATVATDVSAVQVTVNGTPVVVLSLNAAKGIVEIAEVPGASDVVLCSYYFDRTDTLSTDNVSAQVTSTGASIDGQVGQTFAFTAGLNDIFTVSVDGAPFQSVTMPSSAPSFNAAVVAATINGGFAGTTLAATTFVDNYGRVCVRLASARSLVIGTGTANQVLGFVAGTSTSRNRTFTTFNYPIVTGNGGGLTTTNPSDVTVLVNGVQVIPTAVDGASGAVTLAVPPPVGATVTIRYFWNSWQDTFDYLANVGVTEITRVGITPDSSTAGTYLNGVSYVLKDNRILWGSAALVSAGAHTDGGATFGESQVSASLVDNRIYLSPCTPTVDTSGPVSVASKTVFQLSHQPTTGNGRGNPLGSSTFGSVSNGRTDLPTSQPSLVTVYWGFGVQDALVRGPVTVLKVDPTTSQVTLAAPVPEGALVFATFYYSTLVDQAFIGSSRGYTLNVLAAGPGGVGTYGITNGSGAALYGVTMSGKGAALSSVTVNFPSGSEFFPDAHIEGGSPVEETATVTFATSDETPARYVTPGASPFYFVDGASDHLRVTIDGSDQQTGLAAGIDLASPTGGSRPGAFASLVSDEVEYTAASGETTYAITTGVDDEVNLVVDGVTLPATAAAGTSTVAAFVTAINAASAAADPYYTSAGSFPNGYTVVADHYDRITLHYTGNISGASGAIQVQLAAGTYATVGALVTQINTQLATVNGGTLPCTVTASATADARIRFTLTLPVADSSGYLEFHQGSQAATSGRSTGTVSLATPVNLGSGGPITTTVDGIPYVAAFSGTDSSQTGVGAIYAAVTVGDVLNVTLNGAPVTVTFTGAENDQNSFLATLNGQLTAAGTATNAAGQVRIATTRLGTTAVLEVLGTSTPAVLLSLGLSAALSPAGTGNVADLSAVSSAEAISVIGTAIGVNGTVALNGSNMLYVESATTGATSSVQVTAGAITTAFGFDALAHVGLAPLVGQDITFGNVAGIDLSSTVNGGQAKVYQGPIARRVSVATTAGRLPYDRIVLRNRIFPGSGSLAPFHALSQTGISTLGGTGATKAGLPAGRTGEASAGAVQLQPTLLGVVGWSGGVGSFGADPRTGQPVVTFYDGTDPLNPANNVLSLTVNGQALTVTFTASETGTMTALGPLTTATTVLGQIRAAIIAAGLGSIVSVQQEGDGIRLIGAITGPTAGLVMGDGSANALLGFNAGDTAGSTPVTTEVLASTLMSHAQATGSFATFMLTHAAGATGYFTGRALATVEEDETHAKYLYLQSLTLGSGSSILFKTPTSASALATGTLLFVNAGDGATGRAAINGFYVTSTNPTSGSGSANTSLLNSGTGQDGQVGQTYVDAVTGLTFTILPRTGGLSYPTGATATVSFRSSRTIVTDGNIPTLAIPGVELTVTNTSNVVVADTARVETFKKEGAEPAIGEVYYVSYNYEKLDFRPKLWSKLADVVAEYGPVSPDNPLSLAAYLAFLNGDSVIATYQVKRATGSSQASSTAYLNAIDAVAGASLPGRISPSVITLLTPATQELAVYMARHCDVQSSYRYRSERTAIFGFASGTREEVAQAIAKATGSTRVRFVYPDIATITLQDVLGAERDYLVDGRYVAAALAASTTAPSIDSATPWEGRQIVGFTSLNRVLNAVVANLVASAGITVVEQATPFLKVRHGLTSDMSNVLTKTPTVIQIADDMQQRARSVLSAFVGIKFLPQVLSQIEGQLSEMFKRAIQEQVISSFTGVKVSLDPEDPTAILVEAYYQPVFPLLYIQVTFRVSMQ